jgi:hypothetical protein
MSEYLVVKPHPHGGFAVVMADTDDTRVQDVDINLHVQHGTLRQAQKAAYDESIILGDCGYTTDPSCYRD